MLRVVITQSMIIRNKVVAAAPAAMIGVLVWRAAESVVCVLNFLVLLRVVCV